MLQMLSSTVVRFLFSPVAWMKCNKILGIRVGSPRIPLCFVRATCFTSYGQLAEVVQPDLVRCDFLMQKYFYAHHA